MRCRFALFLLAGLVTVPVVAAQSGAAARDAAEQALAEGRFEAATAAAEAAVAADEADAEAQYLLGRILYSPGNPARDEREAGRAVARALALQPDNVVYLVARIESLRRESATLFGDLILARQRAALAERLLALDSTNAFAHEELGVLAIRDYYQYHNAIALPGLTFAQGSRAPRPITTPEIIRFGESQEERSIEAPEPTSVAEGANRLDASGTVYAGDRFDVAAMEDGGAAVVSYERRAQRAYADAVGHLSAALTRDPRRRSVYDHVLRLSALSGTYGDAVPVVREMLVQFDRDPATWLYTGLVNHRLGDFDAAEVAFAQALRRMTPADSAAFADLTLILPPADAPAFRADPDGFARRYWTARDPRFLNAANERRTEHYARLVTADLLFRSERLGLPGWKTERGELFVRYGPPRRDVMLDGGFALALEAFADRDPAFAPDGGDDVNRFHVWDYGDFRLVFEDPNRNGEFRLYTPPPDAYGLAGARDVYEIDFVQQAREVVRREPERYEYRPPGRAVELPYRVTAFRGDAGRTDLYVAYGVPLAAPDSAALRPTADVDVTIRTGAFLVGPERDLLFERRRTVYGLRAAQIVAFDGTRLWTSVEALSARPGSHEVSLEFETAGGGTSAVQRRPVEVPDFRGPGLLLSDVLLAYAAAPADGRDVPGQITRNGLTLQPAPWGVFGVAEPVNVYVEMYGLALVDGRTDYEIDARLVPRDTSRGFARALGRLFGRRARGVGTTAEAQGDQTDDWQSITVDATGQTPGVYTLTVTVRDRHSGRSASRHTDLFLE